MIDHPGRAFSERDHFLDGAATPPLQGGECSRPQFIRSFYDRPNVGGHRPPVQNTLVHGCPDAPEFLEMVSDFLAVVRTGRMA